MPRIFNFHSFIMSIPTILTPFIFLPKCRFLTVKTISYAFLCMDMVLRVDFVSYRNYWSWSCLFQKGERSVCLLPNSLYSLLQLWILRFDNDLVRRRKVPASIMLKISEKDETQAKLIIMFITSNLDVMLGPFDSKFTRHKLRLFKGIKNGRLLNHFCDDHFVWHGQVK